MNPTPSSPIPASHARRALPILASLAALLAGSAASIRAGDTIPVSPAAIQQELKSFATLGSVLYVAAHPDDENTQLITYLARGRGYRTAYLSVTRGDGGQNELGPEFGEKLGVARTQELLAARRLDGGRQFFTRALDFGFSKDVNETLRIWDHQQVLADVVRVIRTFRPDVVIAGMNPVQTPGQHGHHVASAVLAIEAFKVCGDPKAFPEQFADGLTPWQPKRLLQNARFGAAAANAIRIEAGGDDPVTGESFAAIAQRSRGQHKTQGFGNFGAAAGGRGGSRQEAFTVIGGEPAKDDIVDGLDLTFGRFPGGAEIAKLADEAIAQFKVDDPAASVPTLLAIRDKLAASAAARSGSGAPAPLPVDPVLADKRAQLDRILQACLGLTVETTVATAEVVPGEKLRLHHTVLVRASVPVRWMGLNIPSPDGSTDVSGYREVLVPGQPSSQDSNNLIGPKTPISQPYWLREEGTAGMFRVDETKLIGRPENPPAFPVNYVFEIGGQTLVIVTEPVQLVAGASEAQARRPLTVIPPVSLRFPFEVALLAPGATKSVEVEVTAARAGTAGTVRLDAPAAWKVSPEGRPFTFAKAGDKARFAFTVTAPASVTSAQFTAVATVGGVAFDNGRVEFNYAHIPVQLLQPPARLRVAAFDLKTRGQKVGYLPGAGDSTAENLTEMGYAVTTLTGADLTPEKLRGLDAVVIGVRAFNERKDLAANLPGLFAWVEAGGTVVAQYNRPGNSLPPLGPYDLSIAGPAPQLRVTDETAPVTFLVPDHPALNTPNKITAADFNGWVQERGAYFPSKWDEAHYAAILWMSDPGETQPSSSLLVAKHGKGYFVYTSLAFFRQLPAGVPGAYRLFANLVSLGKE
jgi:LmbE family N-acetylglucosaminyl deacetylase